MNDKIESQPDAAKNEAAERAGKLVTKDLGKPILEPGPTDLKIDRRYRTNVRPEED